MTNRDKLLERLEYSRKYGEANESHRQLMQDCIEYISTPLPDDVAEAIEDHRDKYSDNYCPSTADMLERLWQSMS